MTKREFEILKELSAPQPDRAAKEAAISAAMSAFDDVEKNTRNSPQDDAAAARPTHVTSTQPRRRIMRSKTSRYAIAASIAAMAVSLPVLMHFIGGPGAKAPPPIVVSELANKPVDLDRLQTGQSKATGSPKNNFSDGKRADRIATADKEVERKPALGERDGGKPDLQVREHSRSEAVEPSRSVTREKIAADTRVAVLPAAPSASSSGLRKKKEERQALKSRGWIAGNDQAHFGLQAARPAVGISSHDGVQAMPSVEGRDRFEHVESNPVKQVSAHPVSTFSVDVDTASYSVVRRWLNQGKLPPKDAVRVEELINYFSYDYARPKAASEPFGAKVSVLPSPWNADRQLVHIGIQGYELASTERPRANLVLLIDVSGSMRGQGRLPLLKNAFKMLLDNMRPDDTVGIVTYASGSGVALQPTKVAEKHKIIAAIDALGAGGSTAGAQGIQDAYRLAQSGFDKSAVNRVILGTDGDFNVGITDQNALKGFIERKRQSGIFLSILGFGRGNYNDALMQTLAQNGNGTAAYIDTLNEARKVLVEEASSTLFPIAKDVKIQFEFNPAQVRDYRLIGYETRALKREDFNNDKVDAGDVGSGHAVTAIYEITPVGAKTQMVDSLRYGSPPQAVPAPQRMREEVEGRRSPIPSDDSKAGELGFLKLRYKLPTEDTSRLLSMPVLAPDKTGQQSDGGADVRFAVAVAAFGQLLRGESRMANYGFDDVIKLANGARGSDPFGLRAEFVNLVRLAKTAQP